MRVLLTENVPKLGEVGDVCNVAPGYGRNYLIPQGIAVLATSGSLKQIDTLKRAEARRQDLVRAEMTEFGKRVARLHLEFTARVGETGRLFGSITSSDIAKAIEEQLGEEMDRRKIILDESIRTLGEHAVPIHLMPGVDTEVTVIVLPDQDEETGEPWLPADADLGDDETAGLEEDAVDDNWSAEADEPALSTPADTMPDRIDAVADAEEVVGTDNEGGGDGAAA